MLQSIVDKQRVGEVSCFIDEEVLVSFKVTKSAELPKEILAKELLDILCKIIRRVTRGKKMEFVFTEN